MPWLVSDPTTPLCPARLHQYSATPAAGTLLLVGINPVVQTHDELLDAKNEVKRWNHRVSVDQFHRKVWLHVTTIFLWRLWSNKQLEQTKPRYRYPKHGIFLIFQFMLGIGISWCKMYQKVFNFWPGLGQGRVPRSFAQILELNLGLLLQLTQVHLVIVVIMFRSGILRSLNAKQWSILNDETT